MMRVPADTEGLLRAVQALKEDQVVAYPTETVYGLGVNPHSKSALQALFDIKKRESGKPVLLIVGDLDQTASLTTHISSAARHCMEKFWPGPLSLVLPSSAKLPESIVDDAGNICVRCPGSFIARELCRLYGGAITSTSANLSGHVPARNADEAMIPGIAILVDGGFLGQQSPSTVLNPDTGCILREGPITTTMLLEAGLKPYTG